VDLKEFKDLTDPVDPWELLAPLEKLENVDTPELRETKDGWDPQVCPVTPDLRDKLENWVLLDPLETWDQEDVTDPVETPVKMVKLDLLEFPANVELVDHPEVMAATETPDHPDHQDLLDTPLATHHSPTSKDPKDPTQLKVTTVIKPNPMSLMLSTKLPGLLTVLRNQRVPRTILVLLAVTFSCVMTTNWRVETTSLILMAKPSLMLSKYTATWKLERHA